MAGAAYYMRFPELVETVGEKVAETIVEGLGGTRFYVPELIPEDHHLVQVIGVDAASRLAAHIATGIGGMWVELPSHSSGQAWQLRARLRELAAEPGETEGSISARLGVHIRTVRRMRAKLRKEGSWPPPAREIGHVSGA